MEKRSVEELRDMLKGAFIDLKYELKVVNRRANYCELLIDRLLAETKEVDK